MSHEQGCVRDHQRCQSMGVRSDAQGTRGEGAWCELMRMPTERTWSREGEKLCCTLLEQEQSSARNNRCINGRRLCGRERVRRAGSMSIVTELTTRPICNEISPEQISTTSRARWVVSPDQRDGAIVSKLHCRRHERNEYPEVCELSSFVYSRSFPSLSGHIHGRPLALRSNDDPLAASNIISFVCCSGWLYQMADA